MKIIKEELLENGLKVKLIQLKNGDCEVRISGSVNRVVQFKKKNNDNPLQAMIDWWNN